MTTHTFKRRKSDALPMHSPGENQELTDGFGNAAAQRKVQHCEQMVGITDIETLLDAHTSSLAEGTERMNRMEAKLDANNTATLNVEAATKELVAFFTAMKGAFKVLNWIGSLARPVGAIVLMCTSFWGAWALWKTGVPPTPPHK